MRTYRRRLAPLALLSALTLSGACNKDAANDDAAGDSTPADGEDKDNNKDKGPGPATAGGGSEAPAPKPTPKVAAPTQDSAPITDPGEVVGTAQVPSGVALTDLSAAMDSFKPGTSALLRMQVPSLLGQAIGVDLGGAKLSAPMSIIVVDPTTHEKPLAVLVEVEDLDKLKANVEQGGAELRSKDTLALIGAPDAVAAAEAFAFQHMTRYPDHTEIVVYPRPLLKAFRPQIDMGLAALKAQMNTTPMASLGSEMFSLYFDALVAMTEQTDRIVVSVSPSESSVDLLMRMYPAEGSTFAAFTAAQTPADHALLTKLPGGEAPEALMSGVMVAGDARDELIAWSANFMKSFYKGGDGSTDWNQLLAAWLDTFDGNFAVAIDMNMAAPPKAPTMDMTGLIGAPDAQAMRDSWRSLMQGMTRAGGPSEIMGMSFTVETKTDALEHEGVSFDLFSTELTGDQLPPEQQAALEATGATKQAMYFATFDQVGLMASASGGDAPAKAAVDAARGKGESFEASPGLQAAIEASKAYGESLIYYINFDAFLANAATPPPQDIPFKAMVMGMGRHEQALSLRLSVRK